MEFLRNNRTTGEWLMGLSTSRDGASLLPPSGLLRGVLGGGRQKRYITLWG